MWGNPLRSMAAQAGINTASYLPYLEFFAGCVEKSDLTGFPEKLEELILFEFKLLLDKLGHLGIPEASGLLFRAFHQSDRGRPSMPRFEPASQEIG